MNNASFNVVDGYYFLEVSGGNKVSYNDTIYVNGSISNVTEYVYLYSLNSLWVKAYSQETGSPILAFNVTVQNENFSYSKNGVAYSIFYVSNICSNFIRDWKIWNTKMTIIIT